EKVNERLRGIGLLGVFRESGRKESLRLQFPGDDTNEVDARVVYQLGDLLKADLGVAPGNDSSHGLTRGWSAHLAAFAGDLIGNAELREQRGRQIDAAAAIRVGDRR